MIPEEWAAAQTEAERTYWTQKKALDKARPKRADWPKISELRPITESDLKVGAVFYLVYAERWDYDLDRMVKSRKRIEAFTVVDEVRTHGFIGEGCSYAMDDWMVKSNPSQRTLPSYGEEVK